LTALGVFVALVLAVVAAGGPGATRAAADRNCDDFQSQAQAQHYFEQRGGPAEDPDGLDADGNGIACESLPCPCAGPSHPGGQTGPAVKAVVDHVADGDTISVRLHGRDQEVRLIGIDTPESVRPGVPVECGAIAASNAMKHMLSPGDRVRLVADPSQDRRDQYGRLLRYVERGGRDVGERQVAKGNANVYVFDNPFARLSVYNAAEERARDANRGVWGRCDGDFHAPATPAARI
jgi:endonuclease YncB( thermonuclease family)